MRKTLYGGIILITLWSCGSEPSSTNKDSQTTENKNFIHLAPPLEVDGETTSSPTETPITLTQKHSYKSDNGENIEVEFSFDNNGLGIATVTHPQDGVIYLFQDEEALSKNPSFKNTNGYTLDVHNDKITYTKSGTSTSYTLIK